jgi:hypothetical protein
MASKDALLDMVRRDPDVSYSARPRGATAPMHGTFRVPPKHRRFDHHDAGRVTTRAGSVAAFLEQNSPPTVTTRQHRPPRRHFQRPCSSDDSESSDSDQPSSVLYSPKTRAVLARMEAVNAPTSLDTRRRHAMRPPPRVPQDDRCS